MKQLNTLPLGKLIPAKQAIPVKVTHTQTIGCFRGDSLRQGLGVISRSLCTNKFSSSQMMDSLISCYNVFRIEGYSSKPFWSSMTVVPESGPREILGLFQNSRSLIVFQKSNPKFFWDFQKPIQLFPQALNPIYRPKQFVVRPPLIAAEVSTITL